MEERETGTIVYANPEKNFWFTKSDRRGAKDLFTHRSALLTAADPKVGDRVSFTRANDERGPVANDVEFVEGEVANG
jgi:cold shock CspA family protein